MAEEIAKFESKEVQKFFDNIIKNNKVVESRQSAYMAAITIPVFKDILKHFREKQGSKKKWPDWSKIYAEAQEKRGRSQNNMLQDSGNLRGSLTPGNVEKHTSGVMWYNPAKTKSGFPYAKAHNDGGAKRKKGSKKKKKKKKKLPQREFMWMENKVLDQVAQITLAFMMKGD